jgi:hypothetical protein
MLSPEIELGEGRKKPATVIVKRITKKKFEHELTYLHHLHLTGSSRLWDTSTPRI